MAQNSKKFLDQSGVSRLWNRISSELNKKAEDSELQSIKSRVESLENNGYDDTEIRDLVTKLTSDSSVEGSVAYQIAQIVNENGNGSIDTLNEIAAWIVSDTTGAAKMASDIADLEQLVGSKSVAVQISEALQTNGVDKYALSSSLVTLSERVKALEDFGITAEKITKWDTFASGNYDASGSAQEVYDAILSLSNLEIDAAIENASK